MFIVLEKFSIIKYRQAMLAPTSFRLVLAFARHFDKALPEPLGKDGDRCSGLITECNGDGILPKFMERQHFGCPRNLHRVKLRDDCSSRRESQQTLRRSKA
jgi:hypothetical protein